MFWRQAARLSRGVVPTIPFAKRANPAVQMTAQATHVVAAAQTPLRAIPVAVVERMTLLVTIAAAVVPTMRPIMCVVTIQPQRPALLPMIVVVDVAKAKAVDVVAEATISADSIIVLKSGPAHPLKQLLPRHHFSGLTFSVVC